MSQTTPRSVLGQVDLDGLLAEREALNRNLQSILDKHTDPWGIKVSMVEVKHVDLSQDMQRAMAPQAEAELEKRAKIIHAEGEQLAAENIAKAAEVLSQNPVSLQLRYLQTRVETSQEKHSTLVFPLPMDLIQAFLKRT